MSNRYFKPSDLRTVDQVPRAPLDCYRIFCGEDVFLGAILQEGRITIIAEGDEKSVVLEAVLEHAGLKVPCLSRDMRRRGPAYQPTPADWRSHV